MRRPESCCAPLAQLRAGETQACAEAAAAQVAHLEAALQSLAEERESQAAQHEAFMTALQAQHDTALAVVRVRPVLDRSQSVRRSAAYTA